MSNPLDIGRDALEQALREAVQLDACTRTVLCANCPAEFHPDDGFRSSAGLMCSMACVRVHDARMEREGADLRRCEELGRYTQRGYQ